MARGFDQESFRQLVRGESRGLGPAVARALLAGLAVPYAAAVALRNWAYDRGWRRSHRVGVPVVSVGNLTVGGAGKTPIVASMAGWLSERGVRVAILSRGYKTQRGENDEAKVLRALVPNVPRLAGADRVALARRAIDELAAELLLLDDGFQHRRLARDLDIVLIDATDPFGAGRLLPAGLLREPATSLRRAQVAMLTRADLVTHATRADIRAAVTDQWPHLQWLEASFVVESQRQHRGPRFPVSSLRGRRVIAFCGIGNPRGFWLALAAQGIEPAAQRAFPDHHHYSPADLESLADWARRHNAQAIVTTLKDHVKIEQTSIGDMPLFSVGIETQLSHGWETVLSPIHLSGPTKKVA